MDHDRLYTSDATGILVNFICVSEMTLISFGRQNSA